MDKKKTASGIFWSAIERVSTQGCQLILSIIIARLVMPSDYGKIAMVGVLLSIAQTLVDSGFTNALIQKRNRTDVDYSTVFWSNLIIGVLVYLTLVVSSSSIAIFYNVHELEQIIKVVSLCVIFNALSIVQRTRFVIDINFKVQSFISVISVLISGFTGIVMAYLGYGVWALIVQALLNSFISMLLFWALSSWRPLLVYSKDSFKSLFGFGSKLMLSGLINTLYMNIYTIAIAKWFNAKDLGLYNRAETFAKQPMYNITTILARVIYPIECEWQNDNKELLRRYNQFLKLTSFAVFPLMFGLASLAEPVINLLLTEKWSGSVPILQILCFAALLDPVFRLTWDIFNVKHRTDYSLLNEILNKSFAVVVLFFTLSHGIVVVCYGMLVSSIVSMYIITLFTNKVLPGLTFFNVLKQVFPTLIISGTMFILIQVTISFVDNNLYKVIVGILVGMISYFLMSLMRRDDDIYLLLNKSVKMIAGKLKLF